MKSIASAKMLVNSRHTGRRLCQCSGRQDGLGNRVRLALVRAQGTIAWEERCKKLPFMKLRFYHNWFKVIHMDMNIGGAGFLDPFPEGVNTWHAKDKYLENSNSMEISICISHAASVHLVFMGSCMMYHFTTLLHSEGLFVLSHSSDTSKAVLLM